MDFINRKDWIGFRIWDFNSCMDIFLNLDCIEDEIPVNGHVMCFVLLYFGSRRQQVIIYIFFFAKLTSLKDFVIFGEGKMI